MCHHFKYVYNPHPMVYSSHKTSYCYGILCAITGLLKLKLATLHTDDISGKWPIAYSSNLLHFLTCLSQLVSSRSKLDARVSELQTQLTETQLQLSKTRDQKEQLGNQLITMEAKLVKVRAARQPVDHTGGKAGQGTCS